MKCVKIKISNLIGGSQTSFYICSKNQILKMEIFAKIQIFEIWLSPVGAEYLLSIEAIVVE